MTDHRIEKLANLCVHYSVNAKPKEKVAIQGNVAAYPLIHEIYKECLLSDAYPMVLADLDLDYTYYRYAKEHQLKFVSPFARVVAEQADIRIAIRCEPNP